MPEGRSTRASPESVGLGRSTSFAVGEGWLSSGLDQPSFFLHSLFFLGGGSGVGKVVDLP